MKENDSMSPYIAGIGLGLALLSAFVIFGWGLGASSAFLLFGGVVLQAINPEYANNLEYLSRHLAVVSPLKTWIIFEIGGLFLGALLGVALNGNFKIRLDRGGRMNPSSRVIAAFTGGAVMGFAARLARGCTSGVALSGGAQLAISGWVFVMAMFLGGFLFVVLFRRLWA